jgi:sigma-B regulation protein RsbU (phosphoserine phosphatase)
VPTRLAGLAELSGWAGPVLVLAAALWLALGWLAPESGWRTVLQWTWLIAGLWLAVRLVRAGSKQAMWRLRHRLLVTYLFIAVMPLVWVAGLGALAAYSLLFQIAMNLVSSQLDGEVRELAAAAATIARANPGTREQAMARTLDPYFVEKYSGLEAVLRENGRETRFPPGSKSPAPSAAWPPAQGVVRRDGQFYLWAHVTTGSGDVTVTVPVRRRLLDGLAPGLGPVDAASDPSEIRSATGAVEIAEATLPPKANLFDLALPVYTTLEAADWDRPEGPSTSFTVSLLTLPSAVLKSVFSRQAAQGLIELALVAGVAVFGVVAVACWVIGITMTRTITGAVHHLDEGTRRVMQGDFSHRIQVTGDDQLAQLGRSFNRMTENIEALLKVAKEKERLQAEIEIAREVQSLLFPRSAPRARTLRLAAVCRPARMVSGDYFDYDVLYGEQVAVAIGDVAGKGVSAALLMATLQSALRTHLQGSREAAAAAGGEVSARARLSPASLISILNQHLCANTAAEKYATFCLGLYDESSGTFTYSNAGHLPPVLVRRGGLQRLDVNGTVVGAFPFAGYGESSIVLEPGDLLACFTDGITEPENAFGEMFGEQRFFELLTRNAQHEEGRIIEIVLQAVREWTGSDELQDDMTLLLARRV